MRAYFSSYPLNITDVTSPRDIQSGKRFKTLGLCRRDNRGNDVFALHCLPAGAIDTVTVGKFKKFKAAKLECRGEARVCVRVEKGRFQIARYRLQIGPAIVPLQHLEAFKEKKRQ